MENEQLKQRIETLEKAMKDLQSFATIPFLIDGAFRERLGINAFPIRLKTAPLAAITAPTGGLTVDAEARTAINTIITRLEDLGLLIPN